MMVLDWAGGRSVMRARLADALLSLVVMKEWLKILRTVDNKMDGAKGFAFRGPDVLVHMHKVGNVLTT